MKQEANKSYVSTLSINAIEIGNITPASKATGAPKSQMI